MQSSPTSIERSLTPDQERCRSEWRNLCFTLERIQVDNLIANCRDKFQFARTYLVYGRHLDEMIQDLQEKAGQGDYTFFTDRGIPAHVMTPQLARRMLKDWAGAIVSKKTRVAQVFEHRFGEDIEIFLVSSRHAARLMAAASFDEADSIPQLSKWASR